jgi:hypothetical protein
MNEELEYRPRHGCTIFVVAMQLSPPVVAHSSSPVNVESIRQAPICTYRGQTIRCFHITFYLQYIFMKLLSCTASADWLKSILIAALVPLSHFVNRDILPRWDKYRFHDPPCATESPDSVVRLKELGNLGPNMPRISICPDMMVLLVVVDAIVHVVVAPAYT